MALNPYARITWRGHTFDNITARAVQHWEYCLSHLVGRPVTLPVFQGCYSTAVGPSAGTHAGSGAVDVGDPGGVTWDQVQYAGRLAGWDDWHRLELRDARGNLIWGPHCHGILRGDAKVSPEAEKQRQDYNANLDGLADHARDGSPKPHPIVPFAYPMPAVNLPNMQREFRKTRGWVAMPGVRQIQRALNLKTGTTLTVDGIAGPKTRAALARWEKQNGGNGDGIPGPLLWLLGAARFEVS